MPQYNSSKKHLVLTSQHGISFLFAILQDQRGFPVPCKDLGEVSWQEGPLWEPEVFLTVQI